PADRQALARLLLDQARKSTDDPASLWVLYREAQDLAIPVCDVWTAIAAIEESSKFFDLDPLAVKVAAVAAMGKSARAPEDFMALAEAIDPLAVDLMSADQYDAADKLAMTALQYVKKINAARLLPRATARSKEVAEAKGKFQAMKSVLQTLAKTPDDPGANAEMGQFLCFIKGIWDLGLRFLVKGSDAGLKALAEKELALPTAVADQIALADGWYEMGDKEKLQSRKTQLLAHAREYYTAASAGAVGLQKPKLEKRLELIEVAIGAPAVEAGTINLFKLIDLKKDILIGEWFAKGNGYQSKPRPGAKLQIPYVVPAEYDLLITVERQADECMLIGLVAETGPFTAVINPGWRAGFELLDGKGYGEQGDATTTPGPPVPISRASVLRCSVRRAWVKVFVDGKQILNWEGGMKRLTPNGAVGPNPKCPSVGTFSGNVVFTGVSLVPILDPGKPLR
ncbi:MAG TPA: hypothetical protein VG457_09915, partial [Planctomycetota bacterium]|nr:hypothetical protein [Planctomycetota bacterium]